MHTTIKEYFEKKKEKYNKIPTTPENVAKMSLLAELEFDLPNLLPLIHTEVMALIEKDCPKEIILSENYELNGKTIHDWEGSDLFVKGQNVQYSRFRTALNSYFEKRV